MIRLDHIDLHSKKIFQFSNELCLSVFLCENSSIYHNGDLFWFLNIRIGCCCICGSITAFCGCFIICRSI